LLLSMQRAADPGSSDPDLRLPEKQAEADRLDTAIETAMLRGHEVVVEAEAEGEAGGE